MMAMCVDWIPFGYVIYTRLSNGPTERGFWRVYDVRVAIVKMICSELGHLL